MGSSIAIDTLNRGTMCAVVGDYSVLEVLTPAEAAALDYVSPLLKSKHILDLGVGGGRTAGALEVISDSYIGVDYVPEMVEQSRRRYPAMRFELADARAMPQFKDAMFDLIVFSSNGICMVDHAGRIAVLKEVRRLLRPGGFFIFSSYNRNCVEHDKRFFFPDFYWSANPARLVVRSARFVFRTLFSLFNRARYLRHEVREESYSILNDKCHDYRTLLYYMDVDDQLEQLREAGFSGQVQFYGISGNPATLDTRDDCLVYVAS